MKTPKGSFGGFAIETGTDMSDNSTTANASKGTRKGTNNTQTAQLVSLAISNARLFRDPDGQCWASIQRQVHREQWRIDSKQFQHWLTALYFHTTGYPANPNALKAAIGQIEALAFESDERPVFLRVAEGGGKVYVDLCDDNWRVVEIDPTGWRVLDQSPVYFRRSQHAKPLPEPAHGGNIDELRPFLNITDESWILAKVWMAHSLQPSIPHPIVKIKGGEGSAKTTFTRIFMRLIDPRTGALRKPPRNHEELMAAANNSWLIINENVSKLSADLLDDYCRLATGSGLGSRKLYTNTDEVLFEAARPILINGIPDVGADRNDFLDRVIPIDLAEIDDADRIAEADFWPKVEPVLPRVLGALFDAIAMAIRDIKSVQLKSLPRMADFAKFGVACSPALNIPEGRFIEEFERVHDEVTRDALEMHMVYQALKHLPLPYDNNATELLTDLGAAQPYVIGEPAKPLPKGSNALSNELRRIEKALRRYAGIKIERYREKKAGERRIKIYRVRATRPSADDPKVAASSADSVESAGTFNLADGADDLKPFSLERKEEKRSVYKADEQGLSVSSAVQKASKNSETIADDKACALSAA